MSTRLVVIAAATAVAAGGAVAVLAPTSASATPDSVVTAAMADVGTTAPGMGMHRRLLTREQRQQLRRTGHLTVTKDTRKHGTVTVAIQPGEATAGSTTSITLTSRDGYAHSYVITDKTKVRVRRQPAALSDVVVGSKADVIALVTPDGDQARRIIARPA